MKAYWSFICLLAQVPFFIIFIVLASPVFAAYGVREIVGEEWRKLQRKRAAAESVRRTMK